MNASAAAFFYFSDDQGADFHKLAIAQDAFTCYKIRKVFKK